VTVTVTVTQLWQDAGCHQSEALTEFLRGVVRGQAERLSFMVWEAAVAAMQADTAAVVWCLEAGGR
jgi:hypothetical protein